MSSGFRRILMGPGDGAVCHFSPFTYLLVPRRWTGHPGASNFPWKHRSTSAPICVSAWIAYRCVGRRRSSRVALILTRRVAELHLDFVGVHGKAHGLISVRALVRKFVRPLHGLRIPLHFRHSAPVSGRLADICRYLVLLEDRLLTKES
jgi:hypothetical protein